MSLLADVWRITKRAEKTLEDIENLQKIKILRSPALDNQLREARDSLTHWYNVVDELTEMERI